MWRRLAVCILVIACTISAGEIFNATYEWQQVPDGVDVPAGLHYKMDLENGGRWAKLLSPDDQANAVASKEVIAKPESTEDNAELDARKQRVEKLRNMMDEIQKNIVSDFEQMKTLVEELYDYSKRRADKGASSWTEDDQNMYEDLCDSFGVLLSQVDNAVDATKHGILGQVVGIYIKYPSREILRLFAAAAQNNRPVAKALANVLRPILEDTISTKDAGMVKSAVFTLSALTRSLEPPQLQVFNWSKMLEDQPGHAHLCTLVHDLQLPFKCRENDEL